MGSRRTPAWRQAASFTSENRSALLWEDIPSVPRATFTPARSISGTGATPEPSFRLDQGLWTQETCFFDMMAQSSGVVYTQWAARALPLSHTPYWSRIWVGVLPHRSRPAWCSATVSDP